LSQTLTPVGVCVQVLTRFHPQGHKANPPANKFWSKFYQVGSASLRIGAVDGAELDGPAAARFTPACFRMPPGNPSSLTAVLKGQESVLLARKSGPASTIGRWLTPSFTVMLTSSLAVTEVVRPPAKRRYAM
jgi:hypothetical protein